MANIMTLQQSQYIVRALSGKGVQFDSGLTEEEIVHTEVRFNVNFPPDLRLILQRALPVSKDFVNWRLGLNSTDEAASITSRLEWPLEGILFDIRSNDFWEDSWGIKPSNDEDKVLIATEYYSSYPKLIPIFSHRYIPGVPHEAGNPVFSVHQTDVIYYGYNLAEYFANEFKFTLPSDFVIPAKPKEIDFWSGLAS